MTQQELAVLNVAGGEHAAESYSINPICKSQSTPPQRAAFHLVVASLSLLPFSSPLERREDPMGLALIVICCWSRVDQASRARFDSSGEGRLSRPERNESQGKEHDFGFSAGGH